MTLANPLPEPNWPLPIRYDRLDSSEAAVLRLLHGDFPDANTDIDAESILKLVLYHRIHPSVSAVLSRANTPRAPWADTLEQRLLECRLLETRAWKRKEAQVKRIAKAFSEHDIDGLFIKGYALARGIYPDPLQRAFGDIDIWVAPLEFDRAAGALTSIDYRVLPLHRWGDPVERTFVEITNDDDGCESPVEVDLHWAFTGKRGLQRFVQLDMPAIRARGTLVEPGMRFAQVEDELVLEACHLVRSSFCPLSAYVDLQHLVARVLDWPLVWQRAEAAGVAAALGMGLTLSAALLGYEPPEGGQPPRPWPRWQRMLLLPRMAPEKIVRPDRLHTFGARFALKLLCQDRLARVLGLLALAPIDLGARLARGLLR